MMFDGIEKGDLDHLKVPSFVNLTKHAIQFSDAVIIGSPKVNPEITKHLKKLDKPVLAFHDKDDYMDAYNNFYEEVLELEPILAD
jgi:starch synthase